MAAEEPSERVGLAARGGGEDVGGLARWGEPDHRSVLGVEGGDGSRGGVGLAGPGGPDDEYEPVAAGDRPGGVELWVPRRLHGAGGTSPPGLERLFLGEQGGRGESPVGDRLGDGSTVGPVSGGVVAFGAEGGASLLGQGREPIDLGDEVRRAARLIGSQEGGDVTGHIRSEPRG